MNLLRNADFEGGTYRYPGHEAIDVPNNWTFWFAERDDPHPMDGNPARESWDYWATPEVRVPYIEEVPVNERGVLVRSGSYVFKAFKNFGAIWVELSQQVFLEAGSYRFSVPIYPELYVGGDRGSRIWAPDPLSGEVQLRAVGSNTEVSRGWLDGHHITFGAYNVVSLDFDVSSAQDVTMVVALRGRHALRGNGFFVDQTSLTRQGDSGGIDDGGSGPIAVDDLLAELTALEAELAAYTAQTATRLANLRRMIDDLGG